MNSKMNEFPNIQDYRIEKELGQGGMATVYLGIQENLNRRVAIKVLEPLLLKDQNFARRFLKEAETAANHHHSNIIAVYDVGQTGNTYYIIMEYLANGSLKDIINRGPLEPNRALRVVSKVAGALYYAHKKGFIHRDIKPDNILFREDGEPVLTDFGIARALDSTTKLTKTGMSIGTPHYMSPEQARSKQLDGRSDLYSLGIVLYEMLTGKVPYDAEDSVSIAIQHIQEPIPVLPANLAKYQPLLNKLLAKETADRFQSADEFQRSIDGILTGIHSRDAKQTGYPQFDEHPLLEKTGEFITDFSLSDNINNEYQKANSVSAFGSPGKPSQHELVQPYNQQIRKILDTPIKFVSPKIRWTFIAKVVAVILVLLFSLNERVWLSPIYTVAMLAVGAYFLIDYFKGKK